MSRSVTRQLSLLTLFIATAVAAFSAPRKTGADSFKLIEIHASRFAYSPSEITLKKGETYKLHLTSDDVPHSLRITALEFKAPMEPNKFTDVLFTPEQVGDFKADCGVYCGKGHKDMSMVVHVTE